MKSKFLSPLALSLDLGLLLLRLFSGGLILIHGIQKLQNIVAGKMQFADPIGLGPEASLALTIFAEVFCAILLIPGLFTRLALIPLITTMTVAVFIVHQADPLQVKELALMYLIIFVSLFLTGPGRYSIDAKRGRKL